jgi:hypothetical protein
MGTKRAPKRVVRAGASLALAALAAAASPARAADSVPAGPMPPSSREEGATPRPGDGRRTIARLPANLGMGLVGVIHADNLVPLLVGGAAAGVSSFFDEDVRDTVTDTFAWSETFETAGGTPPTRSRWPRSPSATTAGRSEHPPTRWPPSWARRESTRTSTG